MLEIIFAVIAGLIFGLLTFFLGVERANKKVQFAKEQGYLEAIEKILSVSSDDDDDDDDDDDEKEKDA